MTLIFHIATREDWAAGKARGRYEVASLETEGFIHCSTREQVIATANRLFQGRADLVLLCIHEARVPNSIRYEGEGEKFPHVYGPLNLDAVTASHVLPAQPDGTFVLPEAV